MTSLRRILLLSAVVAVAFCFNAHAYDEYPQDSPFLTENDHHGVLPLIPRGTINSWMDGYLLYRFCGIITGDAPPSNIDVYGHKMTDKDAWDSTRSIMKTCDDFVSGVAQMMYVLRYNKGMPQCLPPDTLVFQVEKVVIDYLKAHPEDRSMLGSWIIVTAAEKAFCPTAPSIMNDW
jgi:hypothetical protein